MYKGRGGEIKKKTKVSSEREKAKINDTPTRERC